MRERTRGLMRKGLPWSEDVRWPIVAVEALVLIGFGAFMLLDTDAAGKVVLQFIGVVLLVASLVLAWSSFRGTESNLGFFDTFRAGLGVACGMIATASWWSDYIENHALEVILGWSLVAWGVLHVVGLIVVRASGALRVSTIATVGLSLVLGIVLLTGDATTSVDRLNLLGVVLILFGVALAALAYFHYSSGSAGSDSPTPR